MMVAFVIALPGCSAAWAFIAPGLYAHESASPCRWCSAARCFSSLGMAFCYFFVFGTVFKFIADSLPRASSRRRTSSSTWPS